jgi:hypothetical protein
MNSMKKYAIRLQPLQNKVSCKQTRTVVLPSTKTTYPVLKLDQNVYQGVLIYTKTALTFHCIHQWNENLQISYRYFCGVWPGLLLRNIHSPNKRNLIRLMQPFHHDCHSQ